MPIQSVGLLQACVPICMSGPSCKAARPRSTPSANSFFTDGSCNSSPVLINIADDHLPRNQLPNHEIAFNIHTSQADHRDRGKRLRLPSCLLIETASNDAPAHPVAPCSRRFRCRLATIQLERTIPLRVHRAFGCGARFRRARRSQRHPLSTIWGHYTKRQKSYASELGMLLSLA